MRHIENPSIVRKVYSGIFHLAIFSHVQTLRHIETYSGIQHIEQYSEIFRTLCNPCIWKRAMFRTVTHLEPVASSKACRICKTIRHSAPWHSQNNYSSILKDIHGYLRILIHIQPHSQAHN